MRVTLVPDARRNRKRRSRKGARVRRKDRIVSCVQMAIRDGDGSGSARAQHRGRGHSRTLQYGVSRPRRVVGGFRLERHGHRNHRRLQKLAGRLFLSEYGPIARNHSRNIPQCAADAGGALSVGRTLSASCDGAPMKRSPWNDVKGSVARIVWPPLLQGSNATMEALIRLLDDTQWLSPDELAANQFRQLAIVIDHASRYSPHFKRRLAEAGLTPKDLISFEALRKLPLLTRRDLQGARDVYCTDVPQEHLPPHENRTSGSTGEPVLVKRTRINQMFWLAITMREYFWYEGRFDLRFS